MLAMLLSTMMAWDGLEKSYSRHVRYYRQEDIFFHHVMSRHCSQSKVAKQNSQVYWLNINCFLLDVLHVYLFSHVQ